MPLRERREEETTIRPGTAERTIKAQKKIKNNNIIMLGKKTVFYSPSVMGQLTA
jgi:hypothetical protein